MKKLLLLLSLPMLAAITGVNTVQTHNAIVFSYQSATTVACSIEVSGSAGYTPLVHDVDPALFTGAGTDAGGQVNRVYVVGKMSVETALDGLIYSRGLQSATRYYYRITCGSDTTTGVAETKNLPLGMTWVPNGQTDGSTGTWIVPTLDANDRAQEVIDPITGSLLKRTLLQQDYVDEYAFGVLDAESCTGAAWTTPTNCNTDTSTYASYSGTAGSAAPLVAQVRTTVRSSFVSLDYLVIGFNGFGTGSDRTISFCVSTDGTTCDGTTNDVVLPASDGQVLYNAALTIGDLGGWANPSIASIQAGDVKLLIWKKATVGADTVNIDNIIIQWGQSKIGLPTSGGFHDVCSAIASDSWTQCVINGQLYGIRVTDGLVRTLGTLTFLNASIPGLIASGGNNCETFGGGSILWHNTQSNTIYCNASLTSGALTIVKMTTDSTNTDKGRGVYDNYFTYSSPLIVLPSGYDLSTILEDFDSTIPSGYRCGFDAVQGNYIIGTCRAGQQDTYAYTFAFDLGDGTAMGSGGCGAVVNGRCATSGVGIVALNKTYTKPICRWCTFHTLHSQGNTPVMSFEVQRATNSLNYGNNTQVMTLNGAIDATQTTINVTSAWITGAQARTGTLSSSGTTVTGTGTTFPSQTTIGDEVCAASQCFTVTEVLYNEGMIISGTPSPAWSGDTWTNEWSAAPGGFTAGDPVSTKFPHWIQTIAIGDYLTIGSETLRVAGKPSNTQLTVDRGCSYWEATCSGTGSSALTAVNVTAICNAFTVYGNALAYYWDFVADPDASDSNEGDPDNSGDHTFAGIGAPNGFSGSHQTSRGEARIMANYDIMAVPTGINNRLSWGANSNYPLFEDYRFAGQYSPNGGNTYQRHPSNQHMNVNSGYLYNWFSDVTPFVGGSSFVDDDTPSVQVEGTLYRLGTPDPNINPNPAPTRKYLPTMMVCGINPLNDISGPSSHIVTSTTDYTYCYAEANGECRNGGDAGGAATAGQHFMNCPIINTAYCSAGENYTGLNDTCVGNLTFDGNGVVQFGFTVPATPSTIGYGGVSRARSLVKLFTGPRLLPGTANAKPTPDGQWMLAPGYGGGLNHLFLLKNPGMPPLDSVNRQTFVNVPVQIPALSGADNAYIEFGYDSNFYCTSRAEACVAAASNAPYFFASASFSGVTCSSGCSIDVPALPSRVLRYRIVWRSSTTVLKRSSSLYVAVP